MSTETYKINFDEIKRSVSMEQVVDFLRIPGLKQKSARQWKGACPFCKGMDCFVVTDDGGRDKTGAFNCFKCPAGGDQIELVSLSRGNPRKDPKGPSPPPRNCTSGLWRPAAAEAARLSERFGYVTVPPSPAERGGRGSIRRPTPRRSIPPMRLWRGSASIRRPIGSGRRAMPARASIAAAWRLPITGKDGAIVGYFGRVVKDESPTLIFPNGLNPQEHIFGADRVTSGPLYLVRDPIDVLKAFEAGCGNAVCFLTEDIAAIQLEALAALMDERKCESLSFF